MKTIKTDYIKTAALVSLFGNIFLAILKIITGIISNSRALIADGVDSSSDVVISVISLVVVGVITKPADKEHPYGHRRAETIATALLAIILFFTGGQLIIDSFFALINGKLAAVPTFSAIIVTVASIIGKSLLALSQHILGKRADSAMIKANAKNMLGDIFISLSVLIGIGISKVSGSPIADTIIAILIGLWVIKTSVGIFIEVNIELMDGTKEIEPYKVILDSVNVVDGALKPHRARVRKIAGFWDIDFDIEVDPKLTIIQAHKIASLVEEEIKSRMENVLDIMIHVEPAGDDADESFGLSEYAMKDL